MESISKVCMPLVPTGLEAVESLFDDGQSPLQFWSKFFPTYNVEFFFGGCIEIGVSNVSCKALEMFCFGNNGEEPNAGELDH